MKALFTDNQNENTLVIGLEPNNRISIMIDGEVHELDYEEAVEFYGQFGKYLNQQEQNIKKQLPWWRRVL